MNPLLLPTLLLAAGLFYVGGRVARHSSSGWAAGIGILLAVPAIIFAAYYTKVFGEALWLYWFRSLPGTELSAAGIGFLAGWLQTRSRENLRWKRLASPFFIPFLTTVVIAVPYLKQIFLRPDWQQFGNRWHGDVCIQSSAFSCGPASAATLLRHFGIAATELELAHESFTTRSGTENWYLFRALHRRGLDVHYVVTPPGPDHVVFPSVAGVVQPGGTGHFIALLGTNGQNILVGDPMGGRTKLRRKDLQARYAFTGFYLVCNPSSTTQ